MLREQVHRRYRTPGGPRSGLSAIEMRHPAVPVPSEERVYETCSPGITVFPGGEFRPGSAVMFAMMFIARGSARSPDWKVGIPELHGNHGSSSDSMDQRKLEAAIATRTPADKKELEHMEDCLCLNVTVEEWQEEPTADSSCHHTLGFVTATRVTLANKSVEYELRIMSLWQRTCCVNNDGAYGGRRA
ncbi:hypothetical protein F2P81_014618 [Scophthalmus maximus]|uniref:Uncharacterized protein n=1 Tax=Scophthalmus maximus TaxID=52904 RepID=A0A6A4SJL0_SCOMX|nr:hypothetical protein F2P81_014618 [Scophthalmus maximus]